jgi:hypothetical protein
VGIERCSIDRKRSADDRRLWNERDSIMTMNKNLIDAAPVSRAGVVPHLKTSKIGIVSRDYSRRDANGFRDFSNSFPEILKLLDQKGCDTVLFSLYSIVPRKSFHPLSHFKAHNIKSVLYEERSRHGKKTNGKLKKPGKKRKGNFVVLHRKAHRWSKYILQQKFGSLTGMKKGCMSDFVADEIPSHRVLGNSCILLCGESNGVKYSRKDKKVHDVFGLREAIPKEATIILNPIHDRMTRHEMKKKRRFLSQRGRWVISVWNKGKEYNGKTRDGKGPAWTVFRNGKDCTKKMVKPIENPLKENRVGIEIGILKITSA